MFKNVDGVGNNADPDQTAIGVRSGSALFAPTYLPLRKLRIITANMNFDLTCIASNLICLQEERD